FWLDALLRHKLPPAKTLELGCAHGGLVALMQQAGYDSIGVEMSPWVADYARRAFDIPVLCGQVETLTFEPGSFDAVTLLDVLEHLPNPRGSLEACVRLLRPEGVLMIQTPCYRPTT